MIHRLPIEIVSKIFGYLSIKDARACTNAYDISITPGNMNRLRGQYSRLRDAIRKINKVLCERQSIRIYIGESFPSSKELMQRMTVYDAWISGSGMLEFYVPGSTGHESDWDFYIRTDIKKVIYFMEFMKTLGVTWISTVDYYVNKMESGGQDIIMTYADLEYLSRYTGTGIPDYIKRFITTIYAQDHDVSNLQSSDHTIYELEESGKPNCTVRIHTGTYGSVSIDSIIRGKLSYRGIETNIQLILTGNEEYSNMNAIRNFDLSIVQGAITGFMAFHMYSSHAYNKSGSIWIVDEANKIQCDITKERVKKYKKRGFKLQEGSITINENYLPHDRVIIRQMGDPDTDMIVHTSGYNHHQDPYYFVKRPIYNYTWAEGHSSISSNFIVDDRRIKIEENIRKYLRSQGIYDIDTIESVLRDGTVPDSDSESESESESSHAINPNYIYSPIDEQYYNKFRPLADYISTI